METEHAGAPGDAFLHMDSTSFGAYPFPLGLTEIAPLPAGLSEQPNKGSYGFGHVDGHVVTPREAFHPRSELRTSPANRPVASWLRLAPSAAPLVFVQALPAFWLGRYRVTSAVKTALTH